MRMEGQFEDRKSLHTVTGKTADWDRRSKGGDHLKAMLGLHKTYVFTLIQKINQAAA